jgi:hypothetical protein
MAACARHTSSRSHNTHTPLCGDQYPFSVSPYNPTRTCTCIKSDLRRFSNYSQTNRSRSTSVRRTPSIICCAYGMIIKSIFHCVVFHTAYTAHPLKMKIHIIQLHSCLVEEECSLLIKYIVYKLNTDSL